MTTDEILYKLAARCSVSEQCLSDIESKLAKYDLTEEERTRILRHLIEEKYIDDHRYAEAYVREKSNLAGWGARKIAFQLRQKGITQEIITTTLASLDSDTQLEQLTAKLERKMRTTKAANNYELRGKLLRYGLGLGFDYEMTRTAIDKIAPEE